MDATLAPIPCLPPSLASTMPRSWHAMLPVCRPAVEWSDACWTSSSAVGVTPAGQCLAPSPWLAGKAF
eukprot:10503473-Heterocapsa_arctica.AAC.1